MRILTTAAWAGALALLAGPAAAAPAPWETLAAPLFSHVGPRDGLPYPVAIALAQDGDGFVWIGTPGGLARWDGYRMRVFRNDPKDPGSLPETIVPKLMVDGRGRLWLGTATGLVARYDPERDAFIAYPNEGYSLGRVRGLVSEGRDGIWAAGSNGLAYLDLADGVWTHATPEADGVPVGMVRALRRDRTGALWVAVGKQLLRRRPADARFAPVALPPGIRPAVTALLDDQAGRLWLGTAGGEVAVVDAGAEAARLVLPAPADPYVVTDIAEIEPGILWFGEYGGGIRELRVADGTTRRFRHDVGTSASLADDTLLGLLVDRSGLVWVSGLGGVDRYDPANRKIATILPTMARGLLGKDVRSMAAAPGGKVWLGFRGEGAALLDPVVGRVAEVRSNLEPSEGSIPRDGVQAIAAPSDGSVWLGSPSGLYHVAPGARDAQHVTPAGVGSVVALLSAEGRLWAGGPLGLAELDLRQPGTPVLRRFTHDPGDPGSLTDDSVWTLNRDRAGRLWVGTLHGLNRLDPGTSAFRRFVHASSDPGSLPDDVVNSVLEDRRGRIWVATAGGIGLLDPAPAGASRFRPIGLAEGLPHANVTMLLEDDGGTIWAGTGGGLAAIDPDTLAVRRLGEADGVWISTYWAGSGARLPDGTLLFGGFGGMTAIRPEPARPWRYRPPVVATAIRIGGREQPAAGPIVVPPQDRSFQVEFAALDYSAPEHNRYAYQLEGFDSDWMMADASRRIAAYTNVPPGRYVLAVRGSNRDGTWSEPPLRLPVEVQPAWYQMLWFRAVEALVGLALVAGLVQMRTAYHRHRQRELERQVAEQTAELTAARARAVAGEEAAHRSKEAAEAADRAKSRFLAVASHEIRTPLNGLLGMIGLIDHDGLDPDQRRYLEIAEQSGETLRSLVESVLEYGRIEAEGDVGGRCDFEVTALMAGTIELFRSQAAAKQLTLDLAIAPDVPARVHGDPTRLNRILLNLVGNALKFTSDGGVTVGVTVDAVPRRLQVTVTDTGIGIAPEMREAIFEDFVQADDSIARRFGGTGLGLSISRRLAVMTGGALTVDSVVGAGSRFTLTVPFEPAGVPPDPDELPAAGPRLAVLVVDDDAVNRNVVAGLLDRLGHHVTVVCDGIAAVEAVASSDFDVVLMDLHMPDMDGIEASRRIRALAVERRARVRIVAATADLTEDSWRRSVEAGIDELVGKPIDVTVLRRALAPGSGLPDAARPAVSVGDLDISYLVGQWANLGMPRLVKLARLFHRVSGHTLAALAAAAAAADRAEVRALAHRLRSGAYALGLVRLASAAATLEAEAARSPAGDLRYQVAALRPLRHAGLRALAGAARGRLSEDGGATAAASPGAAGASAGTGDRAAPAPTGPAAAAPVRPTDAGPGSPATSP